MLNREYILTLSCSDRRGIVQCVSGFLSENCANILDLAQFSDLETGSFFMRVHFVIEEDRIDASILRSQFSELASAMVMQWGWYATERKPRLLFMASREGHCLNDLLFRWRSGLLPAEIVGVVSNLSNLQSLVESFQLPFHYFPLSPGASTADKRAQEQQVLDIVRDDVDLVVLARYMQVLSTGLCDALRGKVINIHHSFLPGFKGARPYHQAYKRGVKLIGATAHFVTPELDEGPIIEQDVVRVDHAMSPEALAATGRDVETVVLARAVKYFIERRIFLNGLKTVVFR
jgi:formyltetrahydrofolate deformylase